MIYKQPPHDCVLDENITLDGVPVRDIQAAIQAAWHAEPTFAKQLAERYGIYDMVCLRCVAAPLASLEPTQVLKEALDRLAWQLCTDCLYTETRERMRRFVTKHSISVTNTNPCGEIWLDHEQQDKSSS